MQRTMLAIAVVLGFTWSAHAEAIKIAGSGQMLPLATELGVAYTKKYPADVVRVNPTSLGQKGGVEAVSEGHIDIATSARRLDDAEKQLPVRAYEIASVAGFFAVNPSVSVKSLTSKQLCGIYAGKIKNWKEVGGHDAEIVVFTRPEADSTKIVMRRRLPGFAKLREPAEVVIKQKSRDMILGLMNTPNSIGMTDAINLANTEGRIVALKLDNKDITSSVTGPIQHYYNFVLKKNPRPVDLRFMEFVGSPEGQAVIERNKAHPLPFKM
jgi:phosphate transport system substrate-binding protein